MEIHNSIDIKKVEELLRTPRDSLEKEFSPYFYRYYARYSDPKRLRGYLELCYYLFLATEAKDALVLDLGCGFGLMATLLGLYGAKEVVGYDLNTEKIDLFKKFIRYMGGDVQNVKPRLGDSSKIDYPDGYFNVVITNETFSHMRDVENSIKEIYRVLKPEGRFLVRDGNNSLFLLGKMRRRRFWKKIEKGPVDPSWFRSTDIPLPYFDVRQKMILHKFPEMNSEKVKFLSRKTAGLFGNEIFEAIMEYEKTGEISKCPEFRYRNPMTGEYPEREINPFSLRMMLQKAGFEVSFIPHFYSESFRNIESAIKRFYHWIEKYFPIVHLFLIPGFALLSKKKN